MGAEGWAMNSGGVCAGVVGGAEWGMASALRKAVTGMSRSDSAAMDATKGGLEMLRAGRGAEGATLGGAATCTDAMSGMEAAAVDGAAI